MTNELLNEVPGIYEIRPKVLLNISESKFKSPVDLNLYLPSSEIGSLTMLEATMIVAILKIFDPKNIFEFGTFLGYTTALLSRNSNHNSTVYSLDLDLNQSEAIDLTALNHSDLLSNDIINDAFLSQVQSLKGEYYLSGLEEIFKKKIKLLKDNSLKININELGLLKQIDFCFIDGGHTYEIIKSDTEKAFSMCKNNSIIIWHDFNSKIHGDVTLFLNEISNNIPIFHISNTMLAFTIIK